MHYGATCNPTLGWVGIRGNDKLEAGLGYKGRPCQKKKKNSVKQVWKILK